MMDPHDYLEVAWTLLEGDREAEWRSALSRAYYAAFHVARRLLLQCGFAVPRADQAHAFLWLRLSNSGHPDVRKVGIQLNDLRQARNRADYDLERSVDEISALDKVQLAADILELLDSVATEPTVLAQITDAMKIYERDVLREVTWHPWDDHSRRRSPARQRSRHVQFQCQRHLPAATLVGLDAPLRQNDCALMHQLEATLGLADRLDGERTDAAAA